MTRSGSFRPAHHRLRPGRSAPRFSYASTEHNPTIHSNLPVTTSRRRPAAYRKRIEYSRMARKFCGRDHGIRRPKERGFHHGSRPAPDRADHPPKHAPTPAPPAPTPPQGQPRRYSAFSRTTCHPRDRRWPSCSVNADFESCSCAGSQPIMTSRWSGRGTPPRVALRCLFFFLFPSFFFFLFSSLYFSFCLSPSSSFLTNTSKMPVAPYAYDRVRQPPPRWMRARRALDRS